jgi:DNA-entry nuclease
VEGDAEYLISKPSGKTDYSWYTVDSQVDPDEPGIYKVYVHASDSSGNVKDREYQVTVNEKKVEPVKAAAPQGTDYVLNTNTYKFHYPWCSSVKKMKSKNRWDYNGTRDEVIQMGYDPCKNCDP